MAERRNASSSSRSRQRGRGLGGLAHPHGLVAAERVALVPAGIGEGLLEVVGQPVHLPAQVEVLEQALGQPLQLRPLLGGHRVPHGLGGGQPPGQLLQQLVEVGGVAGEQVPVLLHERLEARVDRLAGLALFDHAVEGVEGVPHALELGRVGVGQRFRHLLEVGAGHLLTKPLHEVLEVLARLRRDELVVLEAAAPCRPGRAGGDRAACAARRPPGRSPPGGARPRMRRRRPPVSRCPTRSSATTCGELLGHLAVGAAEVSPFELSSRSSRSRSSRSRRPSTSLAVGGPPAAVEHPLQRLVQVPVGQQVVGQLREDGVGVVDERILRAVPPAVVEAPGHPRPR